MQICPNVSKDLYKACTYLALITTHTPGQSKSESDKNSKGESRSLGGRNYWNMESFRLRRPLKSWDSQTPNFQYCMWQRKKRWFCSEKEPTHLICTQTTLEWKDSFIWTVQAQCTFCFTWSLRYSPPVTSVVKCFTSFVTWSEDLCIQQNVSFSRQSGWQDLCTSFLWKMD